MRFDWDDGRNNALDGRADLRIVGNENRTLTGYWQLPNLTPGTNTDKWKLYRGNGKMPGRAPVYGVDVYVGLITYAQGFGNLPFVGTADSFTIVRSGR